MGIVNYNNECRKIVMRYSKEWEVCCCFVLLLFTIVVYYCYRLLFLYCVPYPSSSYRGWGDGLTLKMTTKPFTLGSWRASGEPNQSKY